MNRDNAQIVASIVERIDKLEKTIFKLQNLSNKTSFTITGVNNMMSTTNAGEISVELNVGEIATVVFAQDILELFINTLNLELDELVKKLEEY